MKLDINKKTKGLIFDMDGTLADTAPIHFMAWKAAAAEHGFEYTKELFFSLTGMPSLKIVPVINEILNLDLNPEEFSRRKEEIFLQQINEINPIEPVAELVYKYHGKLPMSVGTGGRREIAELTLKKTGLDQYLHILVAAEDVENHKPAPDTFLKCAEQMSVEPEFCEVFEDGDMGLKAARSAGITATDIRPYL